MIRTLVLVATLTLAACHPASNARDVTPDEDAQLNNAAATLDGNGDAP